ncbi:GIY-YIG nuclease family protein [Aliarcobacter butzleri]|uniref:GIY-YIG nuclease family protein n=1 Tax=Aliarcobacter butzleri TaxID=28197 RepID=UPI00126A5B0E|nr:GIY-YIG nuclease family protein [Aliarcobacter butzleri]
MPLPPFDLLLKDWKEHTIKFTLCPTLWNHCSVDTYLVGKEIKEIKFFSSDTENIHNDIKELPNDKGGIYFFTLKNNILPNLSTQIMYIGRAKNTAHQNLRKRCREYFTKYYHDYHDRPHIHVMLKNWKDHLYLNFIELTDNDEIDMLEKKLINSMVPPFNHDIPNTEIKQINTAASAF